MPHPNPPHPYPGAPSPVLPPALDAQPLPTGDAALPPPIRGPPGLADDLLQGAEAIATFIFGTKARVRQVYRLATEVAAQYRMPTFKLGNNTLCARKSVILAWIAEQEAARRAPDPHGDIEVDGPRLTASAQARNAQRTSSQVIFDRRQKAKARASLRGNVAEEALAGK